MHKDNGHEQRTDKDDGIHSLHYMSTLDWATSLWYRFESALRLVIGSLVSIRSQQTLAYPADPGTGKKNEMRAFIADSFPPMFVF
jgi:hypothetical protein